jgi:uncharacterized BrkB/YihY/UPF0761 family membrane protein
MRNDRSRTGVDGERVLRTLTFWLRPAFVLRTLRRFQSVAGFDRAIALASSAFTALIPLAILFSAILPRADANDAGQTIINRYGLTGGGAEAVRDLLSPARGASTGISVIGAVLLVIAILSFSRGMQRLFEQTWELKPLSVRNTLNDLIWILGLVGYVAFSWWIHSLLDHGRLQIAANLVLLPASAVFLLWSGWVLSAGRIQRRPLLPFAITGAALFAIYLTGAAVYAPHLFSSYASRYGVVGAVLAMISTLFGLMVVLVGGACSGREVFEELDRIRRGKRPPEDEVRREWDALMRELRLRWKTVRERFHRARHKDSPADRPLP